MQRTHFSVIGEQTQGFPMGIIDNQKGKTSKVLCTTTKYFYITNALPTQQYLKEFIRMHMLKVPSKKNVSDQNRKIFEYLEKALGFVPNLFATYAHSENALKTYLELSNANTSLKMFEKEAVNLVVSEVNNCRYCISAHTALKPEFPSDAVQRRPIKGFEKHKSWTFLARNPLLSVGGHLRSSRLFPSERQRSFK